MQNHTLSQTSSGPTWGQFKAQAFNKHSSLGPEWACCSISALEHSEWQESRFCENGPHVHKDMGEPEFLEERARRNAEVIGYFKKSRSRFQWLPSLPPAGTHVHTAPAPHILTKSHIYVTYGHMYSDIHHNEGQTYARVYLGSVLLGRGPEKLNFI